MPTLTGNILSIFSSNCIILEHERALPTPYSSAAHPEPGTYIAGHSSKAIGRVNLMHKDPMAIAGFLCNTACAQSHAVMHN